MTEYESALLTAENHGSAHEWLRRGSLSSAVTSLQIVLDTHHPSLTPMQRQRIILEVLSEWQESFDS